MNDGEVRLVRDGAVVIDVGINRVEAPHTEKGYKIVGAARVVESQNPYIAADHSTLSEGLLS